ncbi:MAG: oligosaccharide flippase family protein [Oscillospiraceae bacterium]|nr:oligosaccharide flippase family protein [Oscillospiraceae bacterium]
MKRFLGNIFRAFSSNVISLLTGILVGFFIPKMMGVMGYANYKIYTLYLTYLALTSLGLGDGLYLKFAGKDKEELEKETIRYYTRRYYIQIFGFFVVGVLATFFFIPYEYRFISIALCFTILSSQTVGLHQNFSMLTSRFGEYSKRIVIKSACTALFVIALFMFYRITGNEVSYEIYITGVIAIEYALAIWYIFTYKEFNFGSTKQQPGQEKYIKVLLVGFPLLLSNMAGSIFLNLDRQFVSILFPKETYAMYAFAYNMFTLVTTMTSAVSLVLFPSMRRIENFDVKSYIQKYLSLFSILVVFCMIVYFPLSVIVVWFLDKYIESIEILRIILPGLVLSSCVTVIFLNFYKLENKVKHYFVKTLISIGFSALMNYLAWTFFHDYKAISWASIISLMFWYGLAVEYFVRTYKVTIVKNILYIMTMFLAFYTLTYFVSNPYLGTMLYLIVFVIIVSVFYPGKVKNSVSLTERFLRGKKG